MDLISIVVAVYNAEKTIKKCVDSLLGQTYKNIEIILIDDGSVDSSGEICDEYAKTNDRIRVIHQKNSGVSAARNIGIEASAGKYICFVDSDDYVEAVYAETMLNCYKEHSTVPICGFVYHDEVNKMSPRSYVWSGGAELVSLGESFRLNAELYLTALWNKLFDNDEIKKHNIRFDENLSMGEDLRFSVEYFQKTNTENVFAFSDTLYHYTKLSEDTLMSEFARGDIQEAIKSLELIKELTIKYNENAENKFQAAVARLKDNYIYFIMRDKKYDKTSKMKQIRNFYPEFSYKEYRKNRLAVYKELIVNRIKRK